MDRINRLDVFYHDLPVGTLALHQNRQAAFAYADTWLAGGFSISPFSLPLEKKVFYPKIDPFEGLFGVFADSLPDGWGRLLVDRMMRKSGVDPAALGNLDRLAIVGMSGMGALTYRPALEVKESGRTASYDELAAACEKILKEESSDDLDLLFEKGGSSGGARPKILTKVDGEDWIVKFPAHGDGKNAGKREYEYMLCAKKCGIETAEARLFPSKKCDGYFGVKRFDRQGPAEADKIHMVTAGGLLETSHRMPDLDYDLLMRLTLQLTKDMSECRKLFRLMCFNVFAHNRDDHARNFSYLYCEKEARWVLSPAYDLTYSDSIGGEHATTIHGNGENPGLEDILSVARGIGLNMREAEAVAEEIKEIVYEMLPGRKV